MSHKKNTSRISCTFAILLLFLIMVLSAPPAAVAAGSLETTGTSALEFQLVSEGRGWVLLGQQLFWTDDNGANWLEITPPLAGAQIMDVFFLGEQNAWAVLNPSDGSRFTLATTSDGGRSWHAASYDFSELSRMSSAVTEVYLEWRDSLNGWLVFKLASGSNFSLGLLYATRDGGITWEAHDIPLGEPAYFVDVLNGWVAGGPGGRLFRTQDGGESWQEQTPASDAHYQLPVFLDDAQAVLPVVALDQDRPVAEFFRSDDAGQTWMLAGRVPLEPDTPVDISLPFSAPAADPAILIVPNSDRIVRLVEGQFSEIQNEDGFSSNLVALDMASAQSGWGKWTTGTCETTGNLTCTRETRLLSTSDGGFHWEAIPFPGAGQTSIQENFSVPAKVEDRSGLRTALADPDTQAYVGQGFDKCEIPTLTQLQKWWTSSPYNAVNLYIGGSARGCGNAALSASFLSQANSQGWRFIPTWVGPQASCTGYLSRMSSNAALAYDQGLIEANMAVDTAIRLGLAEADGSGTIIYYDLEAYPTSNTSCRNAANAFISGWVAQLRARGNLGGVYGASCASAVTDWASITNVPDALWIANWYGNAGTVSYQPTASVWGAACLSDSLWSNHERLRQYAGGHNETWDGITLNIDSNVIDGPLTVSNRTAGQFAPSQPLNLGPAQGATRGRNSDTWLTWKTTGDTCSVHIWGGSMDATVNGNCSTYRLGVRPGGSYSWQVTAANGYGNTVGPVWQFNIRPYSPTNLAVTSVASTSINLGWQLSADEPSHVDGYNIYREGVRIGSVGQGTSSYQATDLSCNSSYSFFVKAVRQGVESGTSNQVSATTTTCAPLLMNPADTQVLKNLRPTFEWQVVDVATSYKIQISPDAGFSSLVISTKVSATSYLSPVKLLSNKQYYWRVRGIGPFGKGDWSAVRSFKTANPPAVPELTSPANSGLVKKYQPKLNWADAIFPAGTQLDHYQIQLTPDRTFSTTLYNEVSTVSEFSVPAELLPNTEYYWRVRVFNTLGQYNSWTPIWSFRTAILPPVLASPTDGSVLDHRRPTLNWNDVSDATHYTLQVSKYQDFNTVLLTTSPTVSKYVFTTDLPRNTVFYWRVYANGPNGPSRWSQIFHFTIP